VAVVTGGASGIGRALCRRFTAEGASVVVADVDAPGAAAVAQEIGGLAVPGDVSVEADVTALVDAARLSFDRIDLFCANAGIASGHGLEATDIDDLCYRAGGGSSINLEMRNEAYETHHVRHADLLAIPHAPGERVFSDDRGGFRRPVDDPLQDLVASRSCTVTAQVKPSTPHRRQRRWRRWGVVADCTVRHVHVRSSRRSPRRGRTRRRWLRWGTPHARSA